jgi:glycosyltransferase involved in cell wall biosynthesis|tara:strand:- start:1809 stop:2906 length:1098 start_codon:yes stop_codon:yes gene_type:complete
MKIIFNSTIFFNQRFGGISRYFINLAEQFEQNNINFSIVSPIYKNLYLRKLKKKFINGIFFPRYPTPNFLININNEIANRIIEKKKPDIIHDTYYSNSLLKFKNKKKILTIHDLIHEKFPQYFGDNNFKRLALKKKIIQNSDFFICVSQKTKNDFLEYYKVSEDRVRVIYHGSDHLKNINYDNISIRKKPFLLFIGSRAKYKNFDLLVKAFSNSIFLRNNFDLICFGGDNFSKKELESFIKLKIEQNIKQISSDDGYLKFLYKNTSLLIIPSSEEGFGIPLIEGMNMKCPILVSDIEVFKEIAKDKINYFNDKSHEDLTFMIEKVILTKKLNEDCLEGAFKESEKFKWSICASDVLNVYNESLKN